MGADRTRVLLRWEVLRLVVIAAALTVAAFASFGAFVAAASATAIVTAYGLHRAMCHSTGVRVPRWFGLASALAIPLAIALAAVIDLTP